MAATFRTLFLLFLALSSTISVAADKTPWYQVEIIVFARSNAGALNSEQWPVEVTPAPAGRELVPWRGYSGADTVPFQRLPATSLQLKREFERMKAAPDVTPLVHTGWLQPGLTRDEAVAVQIQSETVRGARVEGSVRLVLSRYLHLETNLGYHRPGDDDGVGQPSYRMTESRRMRSRELHYLDHPLFGVVAIVTPYELPSQRAPKAAPAGGR